MSKPNESAGEMLLFNVFIFRKSNSQPIRNLFFSLFEGKVIFLREETKGFGVYARIYKDEDKSKLKN